MSNSHHGLADKPEALRTAVSVARFAPSLHNTQPWQWHIGAGSIDLHTDRKRHMRITDPDGRLMVFSCGAALHYAHTALQVQGFTDPAIYRLDHGRADSDDVLLARLTPAGQDEPTPESIRALQLMMRRHTDRGPVGAEPLPPALFDQLRKVCEEHGAYLHVLHDDQVRELASITGLAQRIAEEEPHRQAELDEWSTDHQREGVGVPRQTVSTQPGHVRVPPRRFGLARPLPPTPGTDDAPTDAAATYVVLLAPLDTAAAWLRAGEALAAAWLTATDLGIAVQPFSETIEVAAARTRLTGLLANVGYPMLVLRLGQTAKQPLAPPATPRLSISEILRDVTA